MQLIDSTSVTTILMSVCPTGTDGGAFAVWADRRFHVSQRALAFRQRAGIERGNRIVFESLLENARFRSNVATGGSARDLQTAIGFVAGVRGSVYNEEAFRHFLDIERRRSAVSGRPLLLLLVNLRRHLKSEVRVTQGEATAIFSSLEQSVREVDFIGWFRNQRVAAAVLTQGLEGRGRDVRQVIADRVVKILRHRLPTSQAARLQIRILRLE
jgi:hypothetical protein